MGDCGSDERGWYYDLWDTGLPGDARWQIEVCHAESTEDADNQIGESTRGPRGPYANQDDARLRAEWELADAHRQEELDEERRGG